MDRDEIERQDFPAARRGYDPTAVDAHLRHVADEFDAVGRQRSCPSLAEGASTKGMLDKLDRLEGELDRLLAGLKSTAETLAGSLEELSRDVGTLGAAVAPTAPAEPPASAPAEPPAPPATPNGAHSDDEAGARLVALNMALEGTAREETARFLGEHYALADLDALLDDVYASAGR